MSNKVKQFTILISLVITIGFYLIRNVSDFGFIFIIDKLYGVEYNFLASTLSVLFVLIIASLLINRFFQFRWEFRLSIKWMVIFFLLPFIVRISLDPIYMFPKIMYNINVFNDSLEFPSAENIIYHLNYLLLTALLIPILEELVFRKVIITTLLKSNLKLSYVLIISSVLFALIHINFFRIPGSLITAVSALFTGLVFGFVYVKTKNIVYPIILHIGVNLVWYIRRLNNVEYIETIEILNFGILYWGLVFIALITTIALVRLIK